MLPLAKRLRGLHNPPEKRNRPCTPHSKRSDAGVRY